MKQLAVILSAIMIIAGISTTSCAQKNKEKKKEKKVKIKIEKEVDGKITKIDTVFILKEGENLKDVLKEYNIDIDEKGEGGLHTINVHLDSDTDGKTVQKIIIEIDEDGKHKVKSKTGHKMIFISEDGETHDFDIDIDIDEDSKHVYKYKMTGDSTKVIVMSGDKHWVHEGDDDFHMMKKGNLHYISEHGGEAWRKNAKPGDTVIVKTIVTINGKETNVNEEKIIVGEQDLRKVHKKVMIIHADRDGKHKTMTKKIIVSDDDDFEWNDKDENVFIIKGDGKTSKIKVEIDDVDKDDLKKLKLPKSIKPLEVKDLFIMFTTGDKMNLSFIVKDKAKTTVRIYDESGKKLFEEVKNDFSGKYFKEIKKMKGDMIIQVSQGKKYFHKKLEIEY
ncbi:MAG: hypothetical protein DRJ07_01535 [Bacteroidetes bacterium]|nr:MAG: hypothetical protein DRJ07_01535 [Bacteroidota bacterium]